MFKAATSSASTNVVHVRDNNDYVVVEAFEIENGDHENNTTTEADHAVTDDDDDARQGAAAAAAAVLDPHGAAAVAASSGGSGSSLAGAVVGIVKAMVGPAILFLPHGFATTGYLLALPILVGATILYLYSSACLLDSWQCVVLSKEDEKEQQRRQQDVMMPSNIMEVMPLQRRDEEGEGESLSSSSSLEKDHHHHHHLGQTSTTTSSSTPSLSYHELAFRAFGPSGETLIKIGIAAMQSGVCLTYLIFVPHNLTSSFATITKGLLSVGTSTSTSSEYNDYNHGDHNDENDYDDDMSYQVVYWWLLFMLLVEVPLSWIQDISHFVYTNSIANGLILYGLLTCMGVALYQSAATSTTTTTTMWTMTIANYTNSTTGTTAVQDGHPPHHTTPYQSPPPPPSEQQQQQEWTLAVLLTNIHHHWEQLTPMEPSWFLFIGTSVLLFEGSITLLVPLQESVKDPMDRKRFPSVYKRVIVSIVSCYAVFGVTCWMAFGNDVHTVLTTSLPDGILATTVQLAYSVAVIFTFPLQHFPSLEIVTQSISNYFGSTASSDDYRKCCCCCFTSTSPIRSILLHRNVIASAMVCLLALVALLTMESLDKVVSLMGSLLGCPIAFCFPPLIHCRLDPNLSKWKRRTNYLVAGLGFVAMVLASATTILQWRN